MSLTQKAHQCILSHFSKQQVEKKLAIDATCGNGHDTFFLAESGFEHILAFDIQEQAIQTTRNRISKPHCHQVSLIKDDHYAMCQYTKKTPFQFASCIMFNLGYLPNGDPNITSIAENSVATIKQAVSLLCPSGIMTILCYPGHLEGHRETKIIKDYLLSLQSPYLISTYVSKKPTAETPVLFTVTFD